MDQQYVLTCVDINCCTTEINGSINQPTNEESYHQLWGSAAEQRPLQSTTAGDLPFCSRTRRGLDHVYPRGGGADLRVQQSVGVREQEEDGELEDRTPETDHNLGLCPVSWAVWVQNPVDRDHHRVTDGSDPETSSKLIQKSITAAGRGLFGSRINLKTLNLFSLWYFWSKSVKLHVSLKQSISCLNTCFLHQWNWCQHRLPAGSGS